MSPDFKKETHRPYRNDSPTKSILKNYDDIKPISPLYQNEISLPQLQCPCS